MEARETWPSPGPGLKARSAAAGDFLQRWPGGTLLGGFWQLCCFSGSQVRGYWGRTSGERGGGGQGCLREVFHEAAPVWLHTELRTGHPQSTRQDGQMKGLYPGEQKG